MKNIVFLNCEMIETMYLVIATVAPMIFFLKILESSPTVAVVADDFTLASKKIFFDLEYHEEWIIKLD